MAAADEPALLWCLRGHGRDIRCLRRVTPAGFELSVLWGDELFLTETYHDAARLLARAGEFRSTLEARGWVRLPQYEAATAPAPGGSAGGTEEGTPVPAATGAPDGRAGEAHASPDAGPQPTVLVVDDEAAVRSFLRAYLKAAGYAVCEAGDVDSALSALDERHVDAVVLDVRMPDPRGWGRSGLEVLAFIRLHGVFAELPVLILTGHPLDREEHNMARRHWADVFLKPDGYRQLLDRLDQLTGHQEPGTH